MTTMRLVAISVTITLVPHRLAATLPVALHTIQTGSTLIKTVTHIDLRTFVKPIPTPTRATKTNSHTTS
jgi:hypothetical protein